MKLVLLLVALTAVYTANCRYQDSNIEANTDITGVDQLFPDEQVDDTSLGETQRVPIGQENQNIDEDQQMKENHEMGSVSDPRSSMTKERKRCIPTPLCTRAGGYCVKKSRDCNGMLDSDGCRGSKKCKCCIPDNIICGLAPTTVEPTTTSGSTSTIPTPTTTASTTSSSGSTSTIPTPTTTASTTSSSGSTSTIPTPTTTASTTSSSGSTSTIPTPTTTASTTSSSGSTSTIPTTTTTASTTSSSDTTISHNLRWLSVGYDHFVLFEEKLSWDDGRNLCRRNGLELYQPRLSRVVSKYLEDNFRYSSMFIWVGARGNGTHLVWISGDVLTRDYPWSNLHNYMTRVETDSCVWMIANSGRYASGHGVLAAQSGSCDRSPRSKVVLCG